MASEDDQERQKCIMTLKNLTLSGLSVGWVVKMISNSPPDENKWLDEVKRSLQNY